MTMTTTLSQQVFREGNTAVITGASSGIGKGMAKYCASQSMIVYMLDNDEPMLSTSSQQIQSEFPKATIHSKVLDVADAEAMLAVAKAIFESESKSDSESQGLELEFGVVVSVWLTLTVYLFSIYVLQRPD